MIRLLDECRVISTVRIALMLRDALALGPMRRGGVGCGGGGGGGGAALEQHVGLQRRLLLLALATCESPGAAVGMGDQVP
jgi:hypothetical protein